LPRHTVVEEPAAVGHVPQPGTAERIARFVAGSGPRDLTR
jgi:hypothetical protein